MRDNERTASTKTDAVYNQIRADIFAARLQPGERLKFPDLCARYGTSVGVAREALARLAADRLVRPQAHQGYTVVELSADELTDLTIARAEIEPLTFRLAIENGDERWEATLVAAHHYLALRQSVLEPGKFDDEWYVAHEEFHAALLIACPSSRMIEYSEAMRAQSDLYRHWAGRLPRTRERDVAAEHKALLDAALARDAELGAARLREHIELTTQIVLGLEAQHASA